MKSAVFLTWPFPFNARFCFGVHFSISQPPFCSDFRFCFDRNRGKWWRVFAPLLRFLMRRSSALFSFWTAQLSPKRLGGKFAFLVPSRRFPLDCMSWWKWRSKKNLTPKATLISSRARSRPLLACSKCDWRLKSSSRVFIFDSLEWILACLTPIKEYIHIIKGNSFFLILAFSFPPFRVIIIVRGHERRKEEAEGALRRIISSSATETKKLLTGKQKNERRRHSKMKPRLASSLRRDPSKRMPASFRLEIFPQWLDSTRTRAPHRGYKGFLPADREQSIRIRRVFARGGIKSA